MNRRSFYLTIAAGLVVLGIGAPDTRAGNVPLPATYDTLLVPGSTATVVGAETLTFSNFTYGSATVLPSSILTSAFSVGPETGLEFSTSALFAPAGTTLDVAIDYVVTAPKGELINDAFISTTGGNFGGTGLYSVSETIVNAVTFAPVATLEAFTGKPTDLVTFAGVQSLLVTKDIFLSGGSVGETLSIIDQAYSSTGTVPEPTSMALLGIGMTGFLAFRRFFKRPSVA
jgi:hypothetical protein